MGKIHTTQRVKQYMGFTVKPGMVYGRDQKGNFVCTPIVLDSKDVTRSKMYLLRSQRGRDSTPIEDIHDYAAIVSTIRVYRLHPERGWCSGWEHSNTTERCVRRMLREGFSLSATTDWYNAPRASMSMVGSVSDVAWVTSIPGYALLS